MEVRAEIIQWLSDDQPGFVRCRLTDRFGRDWFIDDKVPVVTLEDVAATTLLPIETWLRVTPVSDQRDASGRRYVVIDVSRPDGLSEASGTEVFEVWSVDTR